MRSVAIVAILLDGHATLREGDAPSVSTIAPVAVSMATSNGHSAYDNAYVALAMALISPFYTADELLLRNLGPDYANWIGDIEVYDGRL